MGQSQPTSLHILRTFHSTPLKLVALLPFNEQFLLGELAQQSWQEVCYNLNRGGKKSKFTLRLIDVIQGRERAGNMSYVFERGECTLQQQIEQRACAHILFTQEELKNIGISIASGMLEQGKRAPWYSPSSVVKIEKNKYKLLPKWLMSDCVDERQLKLVMLGVSLLSAALLRSFRCIVDSSGQLIPSVFQNLLRDFKKSDYSDQFKQAVQAFLSLDKSRTLSLSEVLSLFSSRSKVDSKAGGESMVTVQSEESLQWTADLSSDQIEFDLNR